MKIAVSRNSPHGTVRSIIKTTGNAATLELDGAPMYKIPASDWAAFCNAMLGNAPFPPDLPAKYWVAPNCTILSGDLREADRQQVLISSVSMAETIPASALFSGAGFNATSAVGTFHGKHLSDKMGNFIFVPKSTHQNSINTLPGARKAMTDADYLYRRSVTDDSGNQSEVLYRPYISGFAESSKWPDPIRRLRDAIENDRHN